LQQYFQNVAAKVTKERYLEMCNALGNAPIEEEIPISFEDFPQFLQQILQIYFMLPSQLVGMEGTFVGKDLSILPFLIDTYKLPYKLLTVEIIQMCSNIQANHLYEQRKQKQKAKESQKKPNDLVRVGG